jgi:hypothetical protein
MTARATLSSSPGQDAFLQARVRLLLNVLLGASVVLFGFMVAQVLVTGGAEMGVLGFSLQGINIVAVAVGRALVGKTPRTARFVRAVEASVLVAMGAAVAVIVQDTPVGYRPELSLLLVYAVILFGRAALVPSTTLQTIVLCAWYSVGLRETRVAGADQRAGSRAIRAGGAADR